MNVVQLSCGSMHFLPYVYDSASSCVMVELSMAMLHGLSAADKPVTLLNQLRRIFNRVDTVSRYEYLEAC